MKPDGSYYADAASIVLRTGDPIPEGLTETVDARGHKCLEEIIPEGRARFYGGMNVFGWRKWFRGWGVDANGVDRYPALP